MRELYYKNKTKKTLKIFLREVNRAIRIRCIYIYIFLIVCLKGGKENARTGVDEKLSLILRCISPHDGIYLIGQSIL